MGGGYITFREINPGEKRFMIVSSHTVGKDRGHASTKLQCPGYREPGAF